MALRKENFDKSRNISFGLSLPEKYPQIAAYGIDG
jgi:hypothetical protein